MAVRQARAWFLLLLLGASCKPAQTSAREFAAERERMVKEQIAMRGVTNERVLRAMRKVPREQFVPEQYAVKVIRTGRCRSVTTKRFRSLSSSPS